MFPTFFCPWRLDQLGGYTPQTPVRSFMTILSQLHWWEEAWSDSPPGRMCGYKECKCLAWNQRWDTQDDGPCRQGTFEFWLFFFFMHFTWVFIIKLLFFYYFIYSRPSQYRRSRDWRKSGSIRQCVHDSLVFLYRVFGFVSNQLPYYIIYFWYIIFNI